MRAHAKTKMMRIPAPLCEEANEYLSRGAVDVASVNELVVESLREKLHELRRKQIDEAFKGMATDGKYQAETRKIAREFQASDWHALQQTEGKNR
jgi:hypothetical protein